MKPSSLPAAEGTFEALASLFLCPNCGKASLDWTQIFLREGLPRSGRVGCSGCGRSYQVRDAILDLMEAGDPLEVITPFQRLMQFPPVTAIYERFWRPLGFFLASSRSFRQLSRELLALVNASARRSVLDLGCGPGLLSCPLAAESQGWVIGLDLSLPMLRQARRKADAMGIRNLFLVRGSAFRLPFPDGSFDVTLCSGALHLFDRPEAALAEISRTLAPKGLFVCQTTLKPRHAKGLTWFLDRVIRFGFFASPEVLNERLLSAGMRVTQARSWRIIHFFQARHR